MKVVYTLFLVIFILCILTHSDLSLYYAFMGLELWYERMIPALLPFMILSGIMIRLRLTEGFISLFYPAVRLVFRVSKNVGYAIFMGFLCGFPMGAKTVADLYSRQMITKREAEFLLAFVNNIGPVYFISFVIPLLQRTLLAPYLIGMYGIPLLYGFILRNTAFHDITYVATKKTNHNTHNNLTAYAKKQTNSELTAAYHSSHTDSPKPQSEIRLLNAVDESITSALNSILKLGGYMILFNLLNLVPHIILGEKPVILAPLFEITGGLHLLQQTAPLYTLLLLPFGGLSCIAQTNSCINNTDLSIADYTFHKIFLTAITGIYYFLWYVLFPNSFIR